VLIRVCGEGDVIVQDEYSHDDIFRVSDDCFLVFDNT
jgi:hypothetical protein